MLHSSRGGSAPVSMSRSCVVAPFRMFRASSRAPRRRSLGTTLRVKVPGCVTPVSVGHCGSHVLPGRDERVSSGAGAGRRAPRVSQAGDSDSAAGGWSAVIAAALMHGGCCANSRKKVARATLGRGGSICTLSVASSHKSSQIFALRAVLSHDQLMHRLVDRFVQQPPWNSIARLALLPCRRSRSAVRHSRVWRMPRNSLA
jgi:hypothetical protein